MALYKDFAIEGGTVTLNMDHSGSVVHTKDAVWCCIFELPIKVTIVDGVPVSQFVDSAKVKPSKPSEQQTVKVNLTGDKWLVDMAGEVIDQIHDQSKHGRVVIKRDE